MLCTNVVFFRGWVTWPMGGYMLFQVLLATRLLCFSERHSDV